MMDLIVSTKFKEGDRIYYLSPMGAKTKQYGVVVSHEKAIEWAIGRRRNDNRPRVIIKTDQGRGWVTVPEDRVFLEKPVESSGGSFLKAMEQLMDII